LTSCLLPSWTIFKRKLNLEKWYKTIERIGLLDSGYYICTFENRWTNNELGIAYFEEHFESYTRSTLKEEY